MNKRIAKKILGGWRNCYSKNQISKAMRVFKIGSDRFNQYMLKKIACLYEVPMSMLLGVQPIGLDFNEIMLQGHVRKVDIKGEISQDER